MHWRGRRGLPSRGWPAIAAALFALAVIGGQLIVPVLSDEAYFVSWGLTPALGYYDHGPLTGWLSAIAIAIERAIGIEVHGAVHRLFALLMVLATVGMVAARLRRDGLERQDIWRLGLSFLIVPGTVALAVMFVNDGIVLFLSTVFVLAVERILRGAGWRWVLLGGAAFGGVLLVKYSGALIFIAVAIAVLLGGGLRRDVFIWLGTLALVAAVPFAAQLWWNWENCAVNFAFNFSFREESGQGVIGSFLVAAFLVTGGVWIAVFAQVVRSRRKPDFFAMTFYIFMALVLLLAVALGSLGANWVVVAGPLAILALAEGANNGRWVLAVNTLLSAVTVLPLLLAVFALKAGWLPLERVFPASEMQLQRAQLLIDAGGLDVSEGQAVATTNYGLTSMLRNAGQGDVVTFSRDVYGRNDDLFVEFDAFAGRDFLIIPTGAIGLDEIAPMFAAVALREVQTRWGVLTVYEGKGFKPEAYYRDWLAPFVAETYAKSPFPYGGCYLDRPLFPRG